MVLKKIIENYNNKHVSVAPSPLRNHNHPVHAEPGLEPDHEVPGDGSRPVGLPVELQRLEERVLGDIQELGDLVAVPAAGIERGGQPFQRDAIRAVNKSADDMRDLYDYAMKQRFGCVLSQIQLALQRILQNL